MIEVEDGVSAVERSDLNLIILSALGAEGIVEVDRAVLYDVAAATIEGES